MAMLTGFPLGLETWKPGKAFSSHRKVREFWTDWGKSENFRQMVFVIFLVIVKWTCVSFAKFDQVFRLKNKTLKTILENRKKYSIPEKSGNFVSPEKWEPCHEVKHGRIQDTLDRVCQLQMGVLQPISLAMFFPKTVWNWKKNRPKAGCASPTTPFRYANAIFRFCCNETNVSGGLHNQNVPHWTLSLLGRVKIRRVVTERFCAVYIVTFKAPSLHRWFYLWAVVGRGHCFWLVKWEGPRVNKQVNKQSYC